MTEWMLVGKELVIIPLGSEKELLDYIHNSKKAFEDFFYSDSVDR